MPKRYTSRKRTVRKKSRKRITRFRRYRTGTRAKAKSYFRLRRAAKNYSKSRKFRRAKKQYKYTAGKGVKNKIKHLTMSEFASLPFYDLARLTAVVKSGSSPNMYDNVTDALHQAFDAQFDNWWIRYGAILPESEFNSSTPFVIGDNSIYPPNMYAFNPILSPVTCGSKMQLYAALYKKFKYVGIKVTWHPRTKQVTQIIPTKSETTVAQRDQGGYYQDTYNAYSATPEGVTVPTTITNPVAVGLMLDPASMKRVNEVKEFTPMTAQNLYMHVYFGKQIQSSENWHLPFLQKTGENVNVTTYQVSCGINNNQQGRLKAASFYNKDTMLPCIETGLPIFFDFLQKSVKK